MTGALNRRRAGRHLSLNRGVINRAPTARTAPTGLHLPDHGLHRFTYALEFLWHLHHHLHRGVSSIGCTLLTLRWHGSAPRSTSPACPLTSRQLPIDLFFLAQYGSHTRDRDLPYRIIFALASYLPPIRTKGRLVVDR